MNTFQRVEKLSRRIRTDQYLFNLLKKFKSLHNTAPKQLGLLVIIGTIILLMIGVYLIAHFQNEFELFHLERQNSILGNVFTIIAGVFLLFNAGFFGLLFYRYLSYRSIKAVADDELPSCTVIVPAYNEGEQVYATLKSLADSDFPEQKLQLLSIDDGSQDDTWEWMQKAKQELGDRVLISQQPENMGKRHALYRGFNEGHGEIFVTVDSDSIVTKDTLRNLVSPFIKDKNCGAVAGNIRVLNNEYALIPKMLDVSFVLSFEFVRSAESTFKSVLCTPGALAAYKRDVVLQCLPEWINQSFMGKPSDIGEDRAMTNMILKQGKHVLFQRNAVAYTNVPEHYRSLYKMFIRWGRSNVRENIEMAKYVFTNFRQGQKIGTRLLFTSQFLKIAMTYPFLIFMLFFIVTHPLLFLSASLVSILILSTFPVLFYSSRHNSLLSFYAYSYSLLYTFGLFWIAPYAIATAGRSGWLTRNLT